MDVRQWVQEAARYLACFAPLARMSRLRVGVDDVVMHGARWAVDGYRRALIVAR